MDLSILFSIFSLTLIIVCSTENLINAAALPQCSAVEKAALVKFKANIVKDTTGILSSWNVPDCCEWEGVTCNPNTGRVTALQIQRSSQDMSLYMKGTISSSLANLRSLETMVISGMKGLTGTIPQSFATLSRLTVLYLEDNALYGTVPLSFGYMTSLKYLSLSGNKLQGSIPPSLGYVNRLVQLTLSRNLLSGPLPSTFKNPFLEILDLSFNVFSNRLNSSIFSQSKSITYIDLSHNKFSGEIPVSVCYLPSVSYIDLSHNNFTGNIPSKIGSLKSLKALSLASNLLTGSIPQSIGNMDKLWLLNISRNGLSGPIDLITNGLPSLSSIDLSYNKFHFGIFPKWLKLKDLTAVSLAGCGIKENFPVFTHPNTIANMDLSDNLFTGDISTFLAKMSSLQSFRLSNNMYVWNISKLVLPDTLSTFDISNNKVYGKLPEFDEVSNLKSIIMSNNHITGEIPRTISTLRFLEKLDISRNGMRGAIPETMGSMTSLQWLDFSNNKFTGRIPESFKNLVEVRHANFKGNMLCGEIPQARPFNVFRSVAYAHNLCLCGKPLLPCKTKSE